MEAKTRREKESEIAEDIDIRAENGDLQDLKREFIIRDNSDDRFTESDVEEILDGLVENSPYKSAILNIEIVYPIKMEEELFEEFDTYTRIPDWLYFVAGGYLFTAIIFATNGLNQTLSITNEKFAIIGIVLFFASYILGKSIEKLILTAEDKVPVVRRYSTIIGLWILIMAVCFSILWVTSLILSRSIPMTAIGAILPTSLGVGIGLFKLLQDYDFD